MIKSLFFVPALLLLSVCKLWSQTYPNALQVKVMPYLQANVVRFQFGGVSGTGDSVYVYRRVFESGNPFTLLIGLNQPIFYNDFSVQPGIQYEYRFVRRPSVDQVSMALAGMDLPPVEHRGTLLLVCHPLVQDSLPSQLDTLVSDLTGDGWKVHLHVIPDTATVAGVKSWIVSQTANDSLVTSVFVLGSVPVPYSGSIFPDGHGYHSGAWPADGYFAEVNGQWSDYLNYGNASIFSQNWNFPFDGKPDQSYFPSDVDLQIGRVDFQSYASASSSEVLLLKRYLRKLHAYKFKIMNVREAGLVDNNFSMPENFAASGYRNMYSLLGFQNVVDGDYVLDQADSSFHWVYGCGGGTANAALGVVNTAQFDTGTFKGVFGMLFGSIFGDWNLSGNLMVSSLASQGNLLSCCWAGRPQWFFHPMAVGNTLGYCARLSMNHDDEYLSSIGRRMVHIGLLGDPTLREHVLFPAASPFAQSQSWGIELSWLPATESVDGYYVYRKNTDGRFLMISGLVSGLAFCDSFPISGQNEYMIRSAKLISCTGGTYMNQGQGVFVSLNNTGQPLVVSEKVSELFIYPNPCSGSFFVRCDFPQNIDCIEVFDADARKQNAHITRFTGSISVRLKEPVSGVYTVRVLFVDGSAAYHRLILAN